MPSSGISQKAVAKVPAIEPAVEIAKRRPAVRPRWSSERARSLTAIGETVPRTTAGAPKRTIVASSGFSRGPGSSSTTRSSTQPSTNGIASTRRAASAEHAHEERRRRLAVGRDPAQPVAEREPGEDDSDQRAPDVERAAEERREHAARGDLQPEEDRAGDEDRDPDRGRAPLLGPHSPRLQAVHGDPGARELAARARRAGRRGHRPRARRRSAPRRGSARAPRARGRRWRR